MAPLGTSKVGLPHRFLSVQDRRHFLILIIMCSGEGFPLKGGYLLILVSIETEF